MEFFKSLKSNKKIQLFVFLVLITFLAFGLGFILGSRFYEPNPIIIQKYE